MGLGFWIWIWIGFDSDSRLGLRVSFGMWIVDLIRARIDNNISYFTFIHKYICAFVL